jgi:hypothetical protein
VSNRQFSGLQHGFYWGWLSTGATEDVVETIMQEAGSLFQRQIDVKPKPLGD